VNLAKILKLYRVWEGLTVREMAEIIDVSAATVSRIERDEPMSGETLAKVLRWLLDRE